MELNVIFEDKEIIVVEKPSGIPSQSDKSGDRDLLSMVKEYTHGDVWEIHRLDRPVGGLMLMCKNSGAAGIMSEAVKNREVKKTYIAVCCGAVEECGELKDYLMKNQRLNITKVVNKGNVGAKMAELKYKRVNCLDDPEYGVLSLIEVELLTGRHHQIRVQMMNMGAPLWGDVKYNTIFKHKRNVSVALWSYGIEIMHPATGENMKWRLEPKDEIFERFKQR